jgi:ABC-type Mn2+/Zn2+ transport system ATPase subunit
LAIIKPRNRAHHAHAVIDALDLRQIFTSKITELSLGQQQRVSVALALIQRADFYLLDEPVSAQDSEYTQKLLDLIALLNKETGVLVISHNTGLIAQYFSERIELA